jgi:hypothetical protein
MDQQMQRWIGNETMVPMVFEGEAIGNKSVDWSRRRIYVGFLRTLAMRADCTAFRITFRNGVGLAVHGV